jgi:hypothetical protein
MRWEYLFASLNCSAAHEPRWLGRGGESKAATAPSGATYEPLEEDMMSAMGSSTQGIPKQVHPAV